MIKKKTVPNFRITKKIEAATNEYVAARREWDAALHAAEGITGSRAGAGRQG